MPRDGANHIRLDEVAGTRGVQRLAIAEFGREVVAGLHPGELKPQADYLYSEGRAKALVAAARDAGWSVQATPHLAFRNARETQRLYMDTEDIDVDEYVRRWSGPDARWIGAHSSDELRRFVWPFLKERGYATASDDRVLEEFLPILGRRDAHLRPGIRIKQRWPRQEPQLAATIRRAVNHVLAAADEPLLPVSSGSRTG